MNSATIEFETMNGLLGSLKKTIAEYQTVRNEISDLRRDCDQVSKLIDGDYIESGDRELKTRSVRISDLPAKLDLMSSLKAEITSLFEGIPEEHRWAFRPMDRMYDAPVGIERRFFD